MKLSYASIFTWNDCVCKILVLQNHTRSADSDMPDTIGNIKSGLSTEWYWKTLWVLGEKDIWKNMAQFPIIS